MVKLSANDRKIEIMHAVFPKLALFGPSALTTKEMAKSAGISEALLYKYFNNKEGLFTEIKQACINECTKGVISLRHLSDNTETLVLLIYLLVKNILFGVKALSEDQNDLRRLIIRSLLGDAKFAKGFIEGISIAWVNKLKSCVKGSIKEGTLLDNEADCETALWFCHHLPVAIGMFKLPGEDFIAMPNNDSKDLLHRTVLFCLRGIGFDAITINKHYNTTKIELELEELIHNT